MPPATQTNLPALGTPRTPRTGGAAAAGADAKKQLRQQRQLKEQHHFKALLERLDRLWERCQVPEWHRQLFASRYCMGDYGVEVLTKEIKDLTKGTALVQKVMDAIQDREEVLIRLTILRTAYDDIEFQAPASIARRHLSEQLHSLRGATLAVIESMVAWRLSVAPRPGTKIEDAQSAAVANPAARGAFWPYAGPVGDDFFPNVTAADYLLHVARDDTVVKSFKGVLNLAEESDPLLFHASVGGIGPHESGKLCPTPLSAVDEARFEAARLRLIEEEIAFAVNQKEGDASQELGEMSNLLKVLTGPLQLPALQSDTESFYNTGELSHDGFADSSDAYLPTPPSGESIHGFLAMRRQSIFNLEGLNLQVRVRTAPIRLPGQQSGHRKTRSKEPAVNTMKNTYSRRGFLRKFTHDDLRINKDQGWLHNRADVPPDRKARADAVESDEEDYNAKVINGFANAFRQKVNPHSEV
eukprot:TRINITY_DN31758_c0_g1_i1.p1 TRINITY_DN31758_c0_g1~~TRINITY_DN31758_c0_g1_i1.p1  ORF type:complete len:470 (+),score=77.45 TRINITY_DN31758_c0_g1_i1:128-1537(+)